MRGHHCRGAGLRAGPVRLRHATPKPPCVHGCQDVWPDQPALSGRL